MGRGDSPTSSESNSRSRSGDRDRDRGRTRDKAKKKEKKEGKARRKGPGSPATDSEHEQKRTPDGGVGGGEASGASCGIVALPRAENAVLSVDFINSLANSINDLTTAMKDVQVGMRTMQQESREQRGQIAVILGEIQGMKVSIAQNNTQYKNDMDKLNAEINEKIAKLKASAPPLAPAPSTASASTGPSAAASPPAVPGSGGARPTRIWIKGFRETLTSKYLVNFANKVLANLPVDLQAGAKAGAPGFGAVVYVDFPPGTEMGRVKKAMTDQNLEHTDDKGEKHKLRTAPDVPLGVRHRGRVLGELWKLLEPHLARHLEGQEFKLGNSNGKLFLIQSDRPLELFRTTSDSTSLQVHPNSANLAKISVDSALASTWVESASRAALREAR
jgi:hypothetical protein